MQTKKKLRAELKKTERAFCDMNDKVMSLQKQLSDTIAANGALKHDLSTEKKQSGKLQQLLDEARADYECVIADLNAFRLSSNQQTSQQEATIADLTAANDALHAEIKKLRNQLKMSVRIDTRPYEEMVEELKCLNTCPEDCAHRANPGPGASICRNCTRNPRAVDKYTTETI